MGISTQSRQLGPAIDCTKSLKARASPLSWSHMFRTETEGRVCAEVHPKLIEAGIYELCQLRRFGGLEVGRQCCWHWF